MHAGNLFRPEHGEFRDMNSQRKERALHKERDLERMRFACSSPIEGEKVRLKRDLKH